MFLMRMYACTSSRHQPVACRAICVPSTSTSMLRGHRPAPCRTQAVRVSMAQQRLEWAHRNGATHPGRALLASLWPHAHGHSDARVVVVRHGRLPQRTRSAGFNCFARAPGASARARSEQQAAPRESQPLPARSNSRFEFDRSGSVTAELANARPEVPADH